MLMELVFDGVGSLLLKGVTMWTVPSVVLALGEPSVYAYGINE